MRFYGILQHLYKVQPLFTRWSVTYSLCRGILKKKCFYKNGYCHFLISMFLCIFCSLTTPYLKGRSAIDNPLTSSQETTFINLSCNMKSVFHDFY